MQFSSACPFHILPILVQCAVAFPIDFFFNSLKRVDVSLLSQVTRPLRGIKYAPSPVGPLANGGNNTAVPVEDSAESYHPASLDVTVILPARYLGSWVPR